MTHHGAFDAILTDIITGKIRPGDRLVERDLVTKLGVSRTPIREAIKKLDSLGLVRCIPNKGAVITKLSPVDAEDLYSVCLPLERLAARLAFPNIGDAAVAELDSINRALGLSVGKLENIFEMVWNDRRFHQIIYQATKNRFLIQVMDELRMKAYVIVYYAWRNTDRVVASIAEHGEIIRALREKDRTRFVNLLEYQLVSAKSFYLENTE